MAAASMIPAYLVASVVTLSGAGSLALFGLLLWTGPFGLVNLRMPEPLLLAWDAGLCLQFFLQHSGMVRRPFRRRLERVAPEHLHGAIYTAASAASLFLLIGCWQRTAANIYVLAGAARWLAAAALALAFAGLAWGVRSLGEFDAFGVQAFLAQARREERRPPKLVIQGPYRFVRHPFYFLAIVALWAAPVLSLDRLVLNVLFTAWIVVGASLEERDLEGAFGEEYRRYRRAVPMLLPSRPAFET